MPLPKRVFEATAFLALGAAVASALAAEEPSATPDPPRQGERKWSPIAGTSLLVPVEGEIIHAIRAEVWAADEHASEIACPRFEVLQGDEETTVTAYCEAAEASSEVPAKLEVMAVVENADVGLGVDSCTDRRDIRSDQPFVCTVSNPDREA
jgi:hypothetical protein